MKKTNINSVVLIIFAIFCLCYSFYELIVNGPLWWTYSETAGAPSANSLLKVVVWGIVALVGVIKPNLGTVVVLLVAFSYLHEMFLPMLFAIIYMLITVGVGNIVQKKLINNQNAKDGLIHYFIGIVILTILYAILSLFNLGNIRNILIVNILLGIVVLIYFIIDKETRVSLKKKLQISSQCERVQYIKCVIIMLFLMITIGRANISLDYDSMWYGARSQYVIANTSGIYEDFKMVGSVYVYSKGFETYLLPLSGFDSYSFIYAGNIVFGISIIYIVYKICRLFLDRNIALWGAVLVSAIPGVMNMCTTAKTDIMTLFMQVLMIYFSLNYIKKKDSYYIALVFGTYIVSQTLKPTAAIFSTTILIAFVIVCAYNKIKCKLTKRDVFLIMLSWLDLCLIWYRTYKLTGLPANSIWGAFFSLLGMKEKYPFGTTSISQIRDNIFSQDVILHTVTRIKEFFFAPNSADTDHIVVAWGTTLCVFCLVAVVLGIVNNIKVFLFRTKEDAALSMIQLLGFGEFLGCILMLWVGGNADGNYYNLFYVTTVLLFVINVNSFISDKTFSKRIMSIILMAYIPFNMMFMMGTNWAWTGVITEAQIINSGYYNHKQEYKDIMYAKGCGEIYDTMASDPSNRVLAFASHPYIERMPCVIESELDIVNWGNPSIMLTAESFNQHIKYVEYDYIYIEKDYLSIESKYIGFIEGLFDNNEVSSVLEENGHLLLELKGTDDIKNSGEMKKIFASMYDLEYLYGFHGDGWVDKNHAIKIKTYNANKIQFTYSSSIMQKIKVYVNDILLENEIEICEGTGVFEIPCDQNAIVMIEFKSNKEIPLGEPDVRVCSYIINSIKWVE